MLHAVCTLRTVSWPKGEEKKSVRSEKLRVIRRAYINNENLLGVEGEKRKCYALNTKYQ